MITEDSNLSNQNVSENKHYNLVSEFILNSK